MYYSFVQEISSSVLCVVCRVCECGLWEGVGFWGCWPTFGLRNGSAAEFEFCGEKKEEGPCEICLESSSSALRELLGSIS